VKIASVNLNKRAGSSAIREGLLRWLERVQPNLLLLQEPWSHAQKDSVEISGYNLLGGNHYVANYLRAGDPAAQSVPRTDRWLSVVVGRECIHTVYFPDTTPGAREKFFDVLAEQIHNQPQCQHLILGDFNMAPRPDDGLYGDQPSVWTGGSERRALQHLLTKNDLVDLYLLHPTADPFTFEKLNRGKMTRFRCDLALVDRDIAQREGTNLLIDHGTRRGLRSFTDHSGLVVTFCDDETMDATEIRPENTAISRSCVSKPTRLLRRHHLRLDQRVLDFGCGRGKDVEWLRNEGFDADGYDIAAKFGATVRPKRLFDVVMAIYVVNVLDPLRRIAALRDAWSFVKPGGRLFVVSRSREQIEREAREGNWKRCLDGYFSDRRSGKFQRGLDYEDLQQMVRDFADLAGTEPALANQTCFSSLVAHKKSLPQ